MKIFNKKAVIFGAIVIFISYKVYDRYIYVENLVYKGEIIKAKIINESFDSKKRRLSYRYEFLYMNKYYQESTSYNYFDSGINYELGDSIYIIFDLEDPNESYESLYLEKKFNIDSLYLKKIKRTI